MERTLFDPPPEPLPAQQHSATSRAAAQAAEPRAATWRRAVLDFIREQQEDGATDEDVQLGLPLNPSCQRPRRVELVRAGLVVDSGKTRLTQSGRHAVVWVAREFHRKEEAS